MKQIFVPGIGQYDNIGDIILRRPLLNWLRPLGQLHVYVGNAPDGYAEALDLGPNDIVYRSFVAWYRAALKGAAARGAVYAAKPGEIQLTVKGMKEHVSVLPLLALIRARGGSVIRVGAGSRGFASLPRLLMRPAIALSNLVLWRDPATARYLGGAVMPDLAFGEGDGSPPVTHRDTLAVSLRSDRPMPPIEWIDAVQQVVKRRGLRPVVVTQVLRDRERSRSLSYALGADLIDWDGHDHVGQEKALRAEYQRSALVLSDRLHVLIAAVTEGAGTLALLPSHSDKIERHFAAAGISNVAFTSAGMDTDDMIAVIEGALDRGPADIRGARQNLEGVRRQVATLLGAAPVVPVSVGAAT